MKLHQKLFWLLVFLLPVQLGRHFWPEWSYVLGLKIDYLAPTIYLTDILVVGVLVSWWWEIKVQSLKFKVQNYARRYWWIISIFLYLLVASLLAKNSGAALYKFAKIVEFTLLGFYVAKNHYQLAAISYPLSGAIIYSSLIAIAQFLRQSSIGGPLWWMGERTFNNFTPGIAKAVINGRLVMRPYATFPHPNVLAGFLLVSLVLLKSWKLEAKNWKLFKWMVMILGIITIIISFSRSVWLVGIFVCLWFIIRRLRKIRTDKKTLLFASYCLLLLLGVIFYFTSQLSTEETISQRLQLIKVATKMVREQPLVGMGLNNFIPQLPNFWQNIGFTYWLQPVHNIFLLIAVETGLLGLAIFLWFLILTYKRLLRTNNQLLLLLLSTILSLGLFDHYWLTLQQPQLLFALVLGLSWGVKRE